MTGVDDRREVVLQTLYLTWSGTCRSATLRQATRHAVENNGAFVHLAVLDDASFADVEDHVMIIVAEELEWLLEAQVYLVRRQIGADDLPVRVVVRRGDIVEQTVSMLDELGCADLVVGAPGPVGETGPLTDLLAVMSSRVDQVVRLADPD
jgi:hypothetical protein